MINCFINTSASSNYERILNVLTPDDGLPTGQAAVIDMTGILFPIIRIILKDRI